MKNILKFICGFFISFFTFAFVGSILYYYITSKGFLLDVAHKTNYYEIATIEINKNLENQIVNDELKQAITKVVTEEKVKEDVNNVITSLYKKEDIRESIKDEITIEFQTSLKNACTCFASFLEHFFLPLIISATFWSASFPS